jgi:hypothetical protein
MSEEDTVLKSQVGPVEIDWLKSVGYFGGVALAVGVGVIEAPIGIFIAAIPFVKMLDFPNAPLPIRAVSELLDGASKPVGGDSEATVRITRAGPTRGLGTVGREARSIWADAKRLARSEVSDGATS